MKTPKITPEELVDNQPRWLFKLYEGERVFGVQKDKLILEVLGSGGKYLLESECGISFKKNSQASRMNVSLKAVRDVKRRLIEEHQRAIAILTKRKEGKMESVGSIMLPLGSSGSAGFVASFGVLKKRNRNGNQ